MENSFNYKNISLNLYNFTLIKLEILKFILIYKIVIRKNNILEKSINYFLNLEFNIKEIKILKESINNNFFNYKKIKNNKVFKNIYENFINKKYTNNIGILTFDEYLYSKKILLDNSNEIINIEEGIKKYLTKNEYFIYCKHLKIIKDNYNMFLKKNIINIEINYKKLIKLYKIIFENNLILKDILKIDFISYYIIDKSEIFNENASSIEIIKEKKKIYKEYIIEKRYLHDNNIYKNQIEIFNNMFLHIHNVKIIIKENNNNNNNIKLLNNLKCLEHKIL